jgi:hypothetical protein
VLWFFQVIVTAGKDLLPGAKSRPITAADPADGGLCGVTLDGTVRFRQIGGRMEFSRRRVECMLAIGRASGSAGPSLSCLDSVMQWSTSTFRVDSGGPVEFVLDGGAAVLNPPSCSRHGLEPCRCDVHTRRRTGRFAEHAEPVQRWAGREANGAWRVRGVPQRLLRHLVTPRPWRRKAMWTGFHCAMSTSVVHRPYLQLNNQSH